MLIAPLYLGIEYPAGALIPDNSEPIPRQDAVNDYPPNARPGSRAPHLLLANGRSILGLFGDGFTLLAADKSPGNVMGCDMHVIPAVPAFASLYGLESGGCVLVRPDGYVGARCRQVPPTGAIEQALTRIL